MLLQWYFGDLVVAVVMVFFLGSWDAKLGAVYGSAHDLSLVFLFYQAWTILQPFQACKGMLEPDT